MVVDLNHTVSHTIAFTEKNKTKQMQYKAAKLTNTTTTMSRSVTTPRTRTSQPVKATASELVVTSLAEDTQNNFEFFNNNQ